MLKDIKASGGTLHAAGVRALHQTGVSFPKEARLVVIVVGDEAGEAGDQLARAFRDCGYAVSALAMLVSVSHARGSTYQVSRVLKALLDAPVAAGAAPQLGWVERVMRTPLLQLTPTGAVAKSATA